MAHMGAYARWLVAPNGALTLNKPNGFLGAPVRGCRHNKRPTIGSL